MILATHIFLAVLILGLSLYFKNNQPKKINSLYGYRTNLSMKNIDTWNDANKFSSDLQVKFAVLFIIVETLSYFVVGGLNSIFISCIFLTITTIAIIPITEYHLKKKFGEQ